MFRFFYQILVYSDFLDPTKKVRFCSTQFRYVSTFSTKFCFWCISTFSTQQKSVRFFSTQFKYVSRFLTNIGIFRLSRPNKKCSILFDPVQICFNFLDQVLLLVYFDFLDSTKECSIFFDSVHICFAFSTKFWCIPTFSTQQKMFDFVRPCSDMFRLSRQSFGRFRLYRTNR